MLPISLEKAKQFGKGAWTWFSGAGPRTASEPANVVLDLAWVQRGGAEGEHRAAPRWGVGSMWLLQCASFRYEAFSRPTEAWGWSWAQPGELEPQRILPLKGLRKAKTLTFIFLIRRTLHRDDPLHWPYIYPICIFEQLWSAYTLCWLYKWTDMLTHHIQGSKQQKMAFFLPIIFVKFATKSLVICLTCWDFFF